jgi:ADP-ribose pyrophosphatase YjhB (NUDIX family)
MTKNNFTATGIVFNSKKQILMIYHNKLQVWLSPGGHIEENEILDDAVLRKIIIINNTNIPASGGKSVYYIDS